MLVKKDQEVSEAVALLSSIKGIGELTAVTVLAETNGFDLIRNSKQLASYAGYDVKEKESGTSVKGKPKISKRGNKHLRKAMHLPTFSVINNDPRYKAIYARLISKHGIKMKAAIAVQRKLLELLYTLFKTKNKYDPDYLSKQEILIND
ncbi:IS110 family transposase [Chitinophagaceae bacterium DXS]|nr:IS110 family transposase [Chitinophagaceae bacterium DXS]